MKASALIKTVIFCLILPIGDKVTFENSFGPNKEYKSHISSVSTTSVNYEAAPEILEKLKDRGITLPIKGSQNQSYIHITKTGSLKADSSFSFEQRFKDVQHFTELNGEKRENSKSSILDENTVIHGFYTPDQKAKITDIKADSVTSEQKELIKNLVTEVQTSVKFPDYPISVGDKFKQSVPLTIPAQNLGSINLNVVSEYTLTEISNDKAYFDLTINYKLDSDLKNSSIKAGGSGNGSMVYDLDKNFAVEYITNSKMNMEVDAGQITVLTEVNSKTTHKTTITDLK